MTARPSVRRPSRKVAHVALDPPPPASACTPSPAPGAPGPADDESRAAMRASREESIARWRVVLDNETLARRLELAVLSAFEEQHSMTLEVLSNRLGKPPKLALREALRGKCEYHRSGAFRGTWTLQEHLLTDAGNRYVTDAQARFMYEKEQRDKRLEDERARVREEKRRLREQMDEDRARFFSDESGAVWRASAATVKRRKAGMESARKRRRR